MDNLDVFANLDVILYQVSRWGVIRQIYRQKMQYKRPCNVAGSKQMIKYLVRVHIYISVSFCLTI